MSSKPPGIATQILAVLFVAAMLFFVAASDRQDKAWTGMLKAFGVEDPGEKAKG
ncbi:MAG: hypothetical protein VX899_00615 [Myxococcota bacterium]|nr:hypothetical protein [Myxococcota bacterium]